MKDFFISMLEKLGMAFWIEVSTEMPRCIYYFGPFLSRSDAEQSKAGFEQDLKEEGASGITSMIFQRPTPDILTLELDEYASVHSDNGSSSVQTKMPSDRATQSV